MKRILSIVLLALFVCISLAAESLFSFQIVADSPLYREPAADPYSFKSDLALQIALNDTDKPNVIKGVVLEHDPSGVQADRTAYRDMLYMEDALESKNKLYFHMKGGTSVGLFRTTFAGHDRIPKIDFEVSLGGYVSTLMNGFGKNYALDYDGSFLVGGTLRFADLVTIRAGLHHFSGHYGDEILDQYYSFNGVNFNRTYRSGSLIEKYGELYGGTDGHEYYLVEPVEYVRDNSWIIALQADMPFGLMVYGEMEIPMNPSWIRPLAHCPADYKNPVSDDAGRPTLITRIGGDAEGEEHAPADQLEEQENLMRTADGGYRALRIHFGAEYRLDLGFARAFAAFDIQFHQDGQTLHSLGTYSRNNPWDFELTVGGGLEFASSLISGRAVRVEAYYHTGRVLGAVQWFYQKMDCVSVGFSIN